MHRRAFAPAMLFHVNRADRMKPNSLTTSLRRHRRSAHLWLIAPLLAELAGCAITTQSASGAVAGGTSGTSGQTVQAADNSDYGVSDNTGDFLTSGLAPVGALVGDVAHLPRQVIADLPVVPINSTAAEAARLADRVPQVLGSTVQSVVPTAANTAGTTVVAVPRVVSAASTAARPVVTSVLASPLGSLLSPLSLTPGDPFATPASLPQSGLASAANRAAQTLNQAAASTVTSTTNTLTDGVTGTAGNAITGLRQALGGGR